MSRRLNCFVVAALVLGFCSPGAIRAAEQPVGKPAGQPAGPAPQLSITIDAAKVGQPISPYIYGQFIEHLGRCIYGGIWAEMLEDRKFFYPVGVGESPWKPLGDGAVATMVRQGAFVGRHSPQVTLAGDRPRGLVQGHLALAAGKAYVGRFWLAASGPRVRARVSLVWGDAPGERQTITVESPGTGYAKTSLQFTAGRDTDHGRLEIGATGGGTLSVGTVSLMPADNLDGLRADTLAVLKDLDAPVYRWPGGNFVSGYDWHDGLGDPDRRPPRKNPAWKGIEPNDFGIDEYLAFCRRLGAEPYITVNSGLGGVQMAVDEVQYVSAAPGTPAGRLRAKNGHPQPYRVKFWSIGNEMYGNWQLGHVPLEQYVRKHNQFAQAMRAADPTIKLVAVGDAGPWSEAMLTHCAEQMDLISEHFYCSERPTLEEHVRQIPDNVRRKVEAHRGYRARLDSLRGKDIRIAMDEWNYWYGPQVFGELGTRFFLKDALGIAAGLNEMARQSDLIFMANYAQTVNVIGCVKASRHAAALETTGLVLKLYRRHFGLLPVATRATRPLDAVAAWSRDRKTLTLAVVNPTLLPQRLDLVLQGAKLAGGGTRWQIAGNDPGAYNDPDRPPKVVIEESPLRGPARRLALAPCSVTLFALPAE